ncbi:hypothetical protein P4O66_018005, partial [Electrophorus voltai]
ILASTHSMSKEEHEPNFEEVEVTLSSDDVWSDEDYESPEEEEKEKNRRKKNNQDSLDEWESPAQEAMADSESSDPSTDEEYFVNLAINRRNAEEAGLRQYVLCSECSLFVSRPTEANGWKQHVCEHKTKLFTCLACEKRFSSTKGLKVHARMLHGNSVHPCKYCLKPFPNRPAKLEHKQTHQKKHEPYSCPDCPEVR